MFVGIMMIKNPIKENLPTIRESIKSPKYASILIKVSFCWAVCEIGYLWIYFRNSGACIIDTSATKTRIITELGSYDLLWFAIHSHVFFVAIDYRPESKNCNQRNLQSEFPEYWRVKPKNANLWWEFLELVKQIRNFSPWCRQTLGFWDIALMTQFFCGTLTVFLHSIKALWSGSTCNDLLNC